MIKYYPYKSDKPNKKYYIITNFLVFLYMNQWSSGMITVYDLADLGSDPDGVKILSFQILLPWRFWDVLGYIDTHLG